MLADNPQKRCDTMNRVLKNRVKLKNGKLGPSMKTVMRRKKLGGAVHEEYVYESQFQAILKDRDDAR